MSAAMLGICMPSFLMGPLLVLVVRDLAGMAASIRLGRARR